MNSEWGKLAVFFAITVEILVFTGGGILVGQWVVGKYRTAPIITVVFALIGLVISFYRAYLWNKKLTGSKKQGL